MKQLAIVVVFAAMLGCGKDDVTPDDMGVTDTGSQDTGSNLPDEGSIADSGEIRDSGGPDMNEADVGGVDAGPDLGGDMGVDVGMDMPGGDGPCAAGFTAHEEVAGAVVACEGAADSLNQCDAEAACGVGWHMCTAAEYRAHFEAVEPVAPNDASYWLASCIRDGAAPTAPSGVVCADCTGTQTGATVSVSYSCVNSITLDTDQLYVGVRAGTACTFAGVDDPGNDAFWNAQPAGTLQAGAFCCVD